MHEVFLSYRRGDHEVEEVHKYLNRRLYDGAAFYDVQHLTVGNFPKDIEAAIRSSRVLIVIIGQVFLQRLPELEKEADVVRQEIATALEARVKILPVLTSPLRPEEIKFPKSLEQLRWQNCLHLPMRNLNELKPQLPKLVPLLLPHLTEYWRRCAVRARLAARVASVALLGLLLGIALVFITGADAWIHDRLISRAHFPGPVLTPQVDTGADFFKRRQVGARAGAAAADRDRLWLDLWLSDLTEYVRKGLGPPQEPGQPERFRLFIASYRFDRDYGSFDLKVSLDKERYRVRELYAFLKSNSAPAAFYRPAYRQLAAEFDADVVHEEYHNVQVRDPRAGEELFLILVVMKQDNGEWPAPNQLGLSFEVR